MQLDAVGRVWALLEFFTYYKFLSYIYHKDFLYIVNSFFVQLLGLFNPLLIQQIIDAVISQGNYSSLNVLGTLLIAMALAQALLGSLRTYLFSDTTNRIDISLGASITSLFLEFSSTCLLYTSDAADE